MKVDLLDTPSQEVRLEIIPLIDVIFCILTFFILAAVGLTRQQAIDLELPSADTGQPLPGQEGQGSDRVYVSIDGFGQVYLDQQPVPIEVLQDVLFQFVQTNPNVLIVLYASRDARYDDVITVLDQLRAVGGNRVALATFPSDTSLSPEDAAPNSAPESPDALPLDQPGDQLLFPDGQEQPGLDPFAPTSPLLPNDSQSPLEPDPSLAPSPSPTQP
ncbi:biopolymer transporter ExbD [Nodosilinea sp. LEGE 07088]|uniref:ExbD/TolR family protein n=1 Tax=Nodosilinea sp. LEGE 07088 TaxID=2777968 RepID=UPI0018827DDC|nr:biopolymer transporter ExbD [Nodosilinea sp. LEGE 07088]MBE9137708.1 biopolymer transporter ExbD [Nodosilinea sp. LEGE 07088]